MREAHEKATMAGDVVGQGDSSRSRAPKCKDGSSSASKRFSPETVGRGLPKRLTGANRDLLPGVIPGDFVNHHEGCLGLLGAVWDLLVVTIGLGTSYFVYFLDELVNSFVSGMGRKPERTALGMPVLPLQVLYCTAPRRGQRR